MNLVDYYEVLSIIYSKNINFEAIFYYLEQPYLEEVLNFIDFIKTNPSKEDLKNYKISEDSKRVLLSYIDIIYKKLKK